MDRSHRGGLSADATATPRSRTHRGSWSRSAPGQPSPTLLERPAVAVGVIEEGEGVPLPALPVDPFPVLEMTDRTDVETASRQLRMRRFDVLHDELQALDRAWCRPDRAFADHDRATRSRWRQLDDAEVFVRLVVDVDREADLLAVEGLRPVDIGDRDRHELELVVHRQATGWGGFAGGSSRRSRPSFIPASMPDSIIPSRSATDW